ncbi:hypothetical protein JVX91_09750 [Pseudomonas sp. PDNC002]|uniref:hypothetical protein n=1 Tax=Pseudomonas sp. PDNC002 TaxID=2811422 RepID=UPI0019632163|nr:hypothetical protein [Pseudomonas sp. PDNC002]QRY81362.1 hypothetical protein JVX91_09750 [Pseudomonas sp. PDNC002]
MQHDPDSLWVEVETWSPYRPQRLLHGRISREDYLALHRGYAPSMVRLDDCQSGHTPSGPVQDLFLSSAHILSINPLERSQG